MRRETVMRRGPAHVLLLFPFGHEKFLKIIRLPLWSNAHSARTHSFGNRLCESATYDTASLIFEMFACIQLHCADA